MTSKTFKSVVSNREVRIWPSASGFAVALADDVSNEAMSTQLAPSDAPALALAILEAAGYDDMADDANLADVHAFNAMHKLQEVVDVQERITAKAKEQAELEEHAAELERVYRTCPSNKNAFVEIARKAREMRKP